MKMYTVYTFHSEVRSGGILFLHLEWTTHARMHGNYINQAALKNILTVTSGIMWYSPILLATKHHPKNYLFVAHQWSQEFIHLFAPITTLVNTNENNVVRIDAQIVIKGQE